MHGRTSDLHSHLIRKCVPANKRPLSEVLGKFTETIPVSLMMQVKQERLVPINAVSLCGSVHILPLLLLFLDTEAQTPRQGRSVQPTSRGTTRVHRQQLAKVWRFGMWRRDIGPLQCKGRSRPDHGCTAQVMFVNPEGQSCFTSASKRQGLCNSNQHHGQSFH